MGAVKDIDMGWARIKRSMIEADGRVVSVGIQGSQAAEEHSGGMTNSYLGSIHEFGIGKVKARSFIGSTIDVNRKKYDALRKNLIGLVVDGRINIANALGLLGERIKTDIQNRMKSGKIRPALSQRTIDKKGSSTPLIDTGELVNSITYKIEKGKR